jgi:anti-anti-sigma factor
MIPQGMELRPALTGHTDALAFGFAGEHIRDADALAGLSALIEYIDTIATTSSPRLVVVDMRNVESLSTSALGKLIAINKRLSQVRWRLLLIIDDPVVREVVASTGLDQFVKLTTSAELGQTASNGLAADFTEAELAEMISSGLTLDDAIREIERLRE